MEWILKMKWFLLVVGITMGGLVCHVYQETIMKSENYWENVGADMDKLLNPDKYTEENTEVK
jgi:hypothetical protein